MDILNLPQGSMNGSGLPAQAEPIAGLASQGQSAQTPAAFSDALLNVIDALAAGQGIKSTRETTVSPQDLSLDDKDDADVDVDLPEDSLLKVDSQQHLLEALLFTSQTPVQNTSYLGMAQTTHDTMLANAQPMMVSQALAMGISPSLQQHLATPAQGAASVEPAASALPAGQSLAPSLLTVMTPVAPALTQAIELNHGVTPVASASAVPTSTLKMDPEPSRWSEQLQTALGERLQVQVKQQIQHATIRLDPPDMGKIDISMQVDNGRVQVQINASHAEVYRALQQTSNDLRQSLTEQNFVQVNVQVSSQSGGQQQGREQHFAQQHQAIQAGAEMAANSSESQDYREDDSVLLTV